MPNTGDTYLTRTFPQAGNRKTFTISTWLKRSELIAQGSSSQQDIMACSTANNTFAILYFASNGDSLVWYEAGSGSTQAYIDFSAATNFKLKDPNGWYHIVFTHDTTQATNTNRLKMYVNGTLLTPSNSTWPSQNHDGLFNTAIRHDIGAQGAGFSNATSSFSGYMSHFHFCDGYAYSPTDFGETDSTTGEWKIKTSPSVSYGTNGFWLMKDGDVVTDSSPNSNAFTATGSFRKSEDNPSNNFCVLNPLNSHAPSTANEHAYLRYGMLEFRDGENGSNFAYASGSLAASTGKFYWETKVASLAEIDQVGVVLASANLVAAPGNGDSNGLQAATYGGKGCQFSNGNKVGDGAQSAYMGSFSAGDVMMVALDLDNNKITFGRNGQWADGSGNANQTYANSTAAYTNLTAGEFYMPAQAKRASGANYGTNSYNFGNGFFGVTAISNAGTNASNNGLFEYDVPSGFTALSTKGLNL